MDTIKDAIRIEQLAEFYKIDTLVIYELADFGIIELSRVEHGEIIPQESLERCERAVRLYTELGVNKEGIEIILDMRDKIEQLQKDLYIVQHRLHSMEEKDKSTVTGDFFEIE